MVYEEIRYEGYGPGGTAVMVECLTDNRNRSVADVRHAFSKAGGNVGTDGSVAYLFRKLGIISFSDAHDDDALLEAAMDAGADDVVTHADGWVDVMTAPDQFEAVKAQLLAAGFIPESAEVTMHADTLTSLDAENAEKMLRLIDRLEDLDDVQSVYSNADISDEIMATLGDA
jgi:YebC/PmpR family DNA-binding regulatory protein